MVNCSYRSYGWYRFEQDESSKTQTKPIILLSGADSSGVDDRGPGARDVPLPHARRQHAGVRLVRGRQLHDRLLLPDRPHHRVHGVRCAHEEDPGGLQREQAHW